MYVPSAVQSVCWAGPPPNDEDDAPDFGDGRGRQVCWSLTFHSFWFERRSLSLSLSLLGAAAVRVISIVFHHLLKKAKSCRCCTSSSPIVVVVVVVPVPVWLFRPFVPFICIHPGRQPLVDANLKADQLCLAPRRRSCCQRRTRGLCSSRLAYRRLVETATAAATAMI